MITTVTLNPAIDRTLTLEKLLPGEVNRIDATFETMGGKGINVARILKLLDVEAVATGMIGKKNIALVETYLNEMHLVYDFHEINAITRTNLKIVDTSNQLTTDLNAEGFTVKASDLRSFNQRLKTWAMRSDFVVLSGSLPQGLPADTYRKLMVEHAGMSEFVLDTDGEALAEGVKAHPFLIKPNLEELNRTFRKNLTDEQEIIAFAHILLDTYDIGMILISLGDKGSLLVTSDAHYRASSLQISVNSTVGAGDAMLAGFLAGLNRSLNLEECLRMANVCGALTCARKNGAAIEYEEVMERMAEIEITKV